MTDILNMINEVAAPYVIIVAAVSFLLCLILLILVIVLFVKLASTTERLEFFMRGTEADSLEGALRKVIEDNQKVKSQLKNNVNEIIRISEDITTAYRKIGIVKYNAFPGMAGKVSSAIALLNNENNGVVINSMHGPEGCYTYVKEIMNGKSINPLTKEDEDALKIALGQEI